MPPLQSLIGYVLDLRPGAAHLLTLVQGTPFLFEAGFNTRVRVTNAGFEAPSGGPPVSFQVGPGSGPPFVLTATGESYNYASGFIDSAALLYDCLKGGIGLTSTGEVNSVITDAGVDATGAFVDITYAQSYTGGGQFVDPEGTIQVSGAVDNTAYKGYTNRTFTPLQLAGPVRFGAMYDLAGNLMGYEVNARILGNPQELQAAIPAGSTSPNLAVAQRLPSYQFDSAPKDLITILGLPHFIATNPTQGILTTPN